DDHEQQQLEPRQQPPRVEREVVRYERLQHHRHDHREGDWETRLLSSAPEPRRLVNWTALGTQALDVCGDVRELLVQLKCVEPRANVVRAARIAYGRVGRPDARHRLAAGPRLKW